MKNILHKLFKPKVNWKFHKAEFTETTEVLNNPARGWYHIFPFFVEEEPDFEKISWCADSTETLALVIINIGAYREQLLDVQAIKNIKSILSYFKRYSYDVILRITYDHEGKAVEREPFFFKQVVEHMEQLTPVMKAFSDVIFVAQGMLIGNWGEMHTSRFVSPDKIKLLWGMMQTEFQGRPYLAVRRPAMWRALHPECCGKMELSKDTTGLFDDAIFGSETHLGTFGAEPKENVGWDALWSREDELEFESKLCVNVPNGGEVICGENYIETFTPETTADVLKKMHITYLNQAYDKKILEQWKQWTWTGDGPWNGANFYDYVGTHLGYRYLIRDVSVQLEKHIDGAWAEFIVNISIENVGFANCYNRLIVMLEGQHNGVPLFSHRLDCDGKNWDCNKVCTITDRIPPQDCELLLSVIRKKDGRRIFFANPLEDDGRIWLGKINILENLFN